MKLGLQSYTLRSLFNDHKAFEMAMKALYHGGYQSIEMLLFGGVDFFTLSQIARDNGLQITGCHLDGNRILHDRPALLSDMAKMGVTDLGMSSPPAEYERTQKDYLRFAADFNKASAELAGEGYTVYYHNHSFEFERLENTIGYEILIQQPGALQFEPDTCWLQLGGKNPADILRRLKGRVKLVHLKDYMLEEGKPHETFIGNGNLDFAGILEAAVYAGAQVGLVEQDDHFISNPVEDLLRSAATLLSLPGNPFQGAKA